MEFLFSDLLNNPKAPKWLRCLIAGAVCGLVILLGVLLALKSPMTAGRIFGVVLAILFAAAAVWLFCKIAKTSPRDD